jgi:hypothetical protein
MPWQSSEYRRSWRTEAQISADVRRELNNRRCYGEDEPKSVTVPVAARNAFGTAFF